MTGSTKHSPFGLLDGTVFQRPPNLPRRRGEPAKVDVADIQGNVLRGYSHPKAAYIFLHVDDVAKGKALLARMLPRITSGEPWGEKPPATTFSRSRRAPSPSFPSFRSDSSRPGWFRRRSGS